MSGPKAPALTWFTMEDTPPTLEWGAVAVVGVRTEWRGVAIVAHDRQYYAAVIQTRGGRVWSWTQVGAPAETAQKVFRTYTGLVSLMGWAS